MRVSSLGIVTAHHFIIFRQRIDDSFRDGLAGRFEER
jgi:hypothetical protein